VVRALCRLKIPRNPKDIVITRNVFRLTLQLPKNDTENIEKCYCLIFITNNIYIHILTLLCTQRRYFTSFSTSGLSKLNLMYIIQVHSILNTSRNFESDRRHRISLLIERSLFSEEPICSTELDIRVETRHKFVSESDS